ERADDGAEHRGPEVNVNHQASLPGDRHSPRPARGRGRGSSVSPLPAGGRGENQSAGASRGGGLVLSPSAPDNRSTAAGRTATKSGAAGGGPLPPTSLYRSLNTVFWIWKMRNPIPARIVYAGLPYQSCPPPSRPPLVSKTTPRGGHRSRKSWQLRNTMPA